MRRIIHGLIIVLMFIVVSSNASAITNLNIRTGTLNPINVLFDLEHPNDPDIIKFIESIRKDIGYLGYVHLIDFNEYQSKHPLEYDEKNKKPSFTKLKRKSLHYYVRMIIGDDRKILLEIWDVSFDRKVDDRIVDFSLKPKWTLCMAHEVSDILNKIITSETANFFQSNVVFAVQRQDESGKYHRDIMMANYDGQQARFLTTSHDLAITPELSPDSKRLMFLEYQDTKTALKVCDLVPQISCKELKFNNHGEQVFSPSFHPNGRKAVVSISDVEGNVNLYEINLDNGKKTRLTFDKGIINTAARYAPSGDKIVFSSNREDGGEKLYILDLKSGEVKKLSNNKGWYYDPDWSDNGEWITAVKWVGKKNYIVILNTQGKNERILYEGARMDMPNFVPGSRRIIFNELIGHDQTVIKSVDIFGKYYNIIDDPYLAKFHISDAKAGKKINDC